MSAFASLLLFACVILGYVIHHQNEEIKTMRCNCRNCHLLNAQEIINLVVCRVRNTKEFDEATRKRILEDIVNINLENLKYEKHGTNYDYYKEPYDLRDKYIDVLFKHLCSAVVKKEDVK